MATVKNRKAEANLKSKAAMQATRKAAAQAAYQSARQQETASNVRTQIWRQGKAAAQANRKAKAAERARQAMVDAGTQKGQQFEPITVDEAVDAFGVELPSAGGFAGPGPGEPGDRSTFDAPAETGSWWSSQPHWLKFALLAGGGFFLYRRFK